MKIIWPDLMLCTDWRSDAVTPQTVRMVDGVEIIKIANKDSSRRYKRDNITSYLLVSEEAPGAKNITTSLVEIRFVDYDRNSDDIKAFCQISRCIRTLYGRGCLPRYLYRQL